MTTALVLIDLQNDYFPGGAMELVGSEQAVEQARTLLEAFRTRRLPLFHVRHISKRPGATFFLPETKGSEIHSAVAPLAGEHVVIKHSRRSRPRVRVPARAGRMRDEVASVRGQPGGRATSAVVVSRRAERRVREGSTRRGDRHRIVSMECPRDSSELELQGYWKYPRHVCRQCHGQLLNERDVMAALGQPESATFGSHAKVRIAQLPVSALKCPRDGKSMHVLIHKDVELDMCPMCRSLWLDQGELDKIRALNKAKLDGDINPIDGIDAIGGDSIGDFVGEAIGSLLDGLSP